MHSSNFALVAAARVTSDTAPPANFYSSSICGTFQTDYRNDIGDGYLKPLRELTSSLFHRQTILYRLLELLQKQFKRRGKRRRTSKASKKKCDENEAYRIVTLSISQISSLAHTEEGVAWNNTLESIANEADFGTKVLRLYTAMLQGPLTHLIRRDEIPSATIVAKACIYYKPNEFMKTMVKKSFVPNFGSTTETDTPDGSNILMNLRIISAGLFCASVLDKKLLDAGENKPVLPIFGHLLLSAVQVLEGFYSFYDDHVSNGGTTAAKYARD